MKSFTIKKPLGTKKTDDFIKKSEIPKPILDCLTEKHSEYFTLIFDSEFLWIGSKFKAKKFKLINYENFELCFMTRAKSDGFVAILASRKEDQSYAEVVDFGFYSDEKLQIAKEISYKLSSILGYSLNISHWGADY